MNPLNDADYSAIEARIVCWLAGEAKALAEYRQKVDRYKRMAALIYGIPETEVNKFPQRFLGKQTILGCGFGMGPKRFRESCAQFGYDLPEGLENKAVNAFRKAHPYIKALWDQLADAAKNAVLSPGSVFRVKRLSFKCIKPSKVQFLLMRLPSGRELAYPSPRIVRDELEVYRKTNGVTWAHQKLGAGTGCTLTENATQAVAADIMAHGAMNAERAGYEIATLIHDQALAYVKQGQTSEEFVRLLTDLPPWAEGLPIEAEGSLVPFYKKD